MLIVDDNDDVRQVGVATLKLLNCRVVEARDPAEALRVLEQNGDIDILFTDLIMPGGLNGIVLAAEARRRRPDLKVVFCSGFAASAMTERHKLAEGEALWQNPTSRRSCREAHWRDGAQICVTAPPKASINLPFQTSEADLILSPSEPYRSFSIERLMDRKRGCSVSEHRQPCRVGRIRACGAAINEGPWS